MPIVPKDKSSYYWTWQDYLLVEKARSISELAVIALRIIGLMSKPIVQVCGPLSTGGLGSLSANQERFSLAINILHHRSRGCYRVFDQMPFQGAMARLTERRRKSGYPREILYQFYLPIFKSSNIQLAYFLSGWQESVGARWEHQTAPKYGIRIKDFPDRWFN